MFRGNKDLRCIVDADGGVDRRLHDQQRLVQAGDVFINSLLGNIVEEFALDPERSAGEDTSTSPCVRMVSTCS